MKISKKPYSILSDVEKKDILIDLYVKQNKSFADIAELYETYPNKVRRDAKKFKIKIRSKSDAQKNALATGKHKHPTKGKPRDTETKKKIGLSVLQSWDNLSETEIKNRKEKARLAWESLDDNIKEDMLQKANKAVRDASKTGSKLEHYIFNKLIGDGYRVDFHKEQVLVNTKLQIDLFLPNMNTAIEVDGPSHFEPIWGDDSLSRNQKYDNKKTGLILGKGWVLIRVKQSKDFSPSRALIIYEELKSVLGNIKTKFPTNNRIFEIGD
jgi:very-short-patch-repair endonuclease